MPYVQIIMDLNIKDRKILYQLDINSRQSLSQIGKKVGLHKNSVDYRIKRLEKLGIIKGYYTVIDSFKLGYEVLKFYINYQYTDNKIEKEIIDYFVKCKYAWAVHSVDGWFDLDVILWIRNRNKFYNFWEEALNRYGDYFQNQVLSFYIRLNTFPLSHLINEDFNLNHADFQIITGSEKNIEFDKIDYKILKFIAPNARISITDLAERLNVSMPLIRKRLRKLSQQKIIQGYRTNIDVNKLGYGFYKIDIYLRKYNQRKNIIKYVKKNPHLIGIDETVGYSHLELEFNLLNLTHLHNIMQDIIDKFPNVIRNYKHFRVTNIYKMVYFPESI